MPSGTDNSKKQTRLYRSKPVVFVLVTIILICTITTWVKYEKARQIDFQLQVSSINGQSGWVSIRQARWLPRSSPTFLTGYFQEIDQAGVARAGSGQLEFLTRQPVTELTLTNSTLTARHVGILSSMRQLERLVLQDVTIQPNAWQKLSSISSLKEFNLDAKCGPVIAARAVSNPPGIIERRFFTYRRVEDHQQLKTLQALERLNVNAIVNGDQLAAAAADLPCLTDLYLHCGTISSEGLKKIGKCHALIQLSLICSANETLVLKPDTASDATNSSIADLAGSLTYLRELNNLQELTFSGYGVTDEMLAPLLELNSLRSLRILNASGITNESVPLFCQMSNLEYLELNQTQISEIEQQRIQDIVPACIFSHTDSGADYYLSERTGE